MYLFSRSVLESTLRIACWRPSGRPPLCTSSLGRSWRASSELHAGGLQAGLRYVLLQVCLGKHPLNCMLEALICSNFKRQFFITYLIPRPFKCGCLFLSSDKVFQLLQRLSGRALFLSDGKVGGLHPFQCWSATTTLISDTTVK